jgi:hypothetical protein
MRILKKSDRLEDLDINGSMKLKFTCNKSYRTVWTRRSAEDRDQ